MPVISPNASFMRRKAFIYLLRQSPGQLTNDAWINDSCSQYPAPNTKNHIRKKSCAGFRKGGILQDFKR